jgi:hypothetical protein
MGGTVFSTGRRERGNRGAPPEVGGVVNSIEPRAAAPQSFRAIVLRSVIVDRYVAIDLAFAVAPS